MLTIGKLCKHAVDIWPWGRVGVENVPDMGGVSNPSFCLSDTSNLHFFPCFGKISFGNITFVTWSKKGVWRLGQDG